MTASCATGDPPAAGRRGGTGPSGGGLQAVLLGTNTTALVASRGDETIGEWYAPRVGPDRRLGLASLSKAVVGSVSLMVALDEGRIGVDDPVARLVPSWSGDPRKSRVTIRHLATHCSGLPHGKSGRERRDGWAIAFWSRAPDLFSRTLADAPVTFEPGTDYLYSGPGFAVLGYAVAAALRDGPTPDLREALRRRIMDPLGIPRDEWSIGYGRVFQENGLRLYATWGGANYTPRAVLRVGQLMLHEGRWNGEQLIRPETVRAAVTYADTPLPPDRPHPAPALGWWSNLDGALPSLPPDAFLGAGADQQVLIVVPSLELVIVRLGGRLGRSAWGGDFWEALDRDLLRPVMEALRTPSGPGRP